MTTPKIRTNITNTVPPMFDSSLSGACTLGSSSTNTLSSYNCNFPPEIKTSTIKNISSVPGPSLWVPVVPVGSTGLPQQSCVRYNDNASATCLHFPSSLSKLAGNTAITQQTFSQVATESGTNWIQDYPPIPAPLIPNPTKVQNIPSSLQIVKSSNIINSGSKIPVSVSMINLPGISNSIKYVDTSRIAPQCVITTPTCFFNNITNNCNILCPAIDGSQSFNYKYNMSNKLWLHPDDAEAINKISSNPSSSGGS